MKIKILLVEDDHLQAAWIHENLAHAFQDTEITTLSTEHQFQSSINQIGDAKPHVIILDVMLRWDDPEPDLSPPRDVLEQGFYRAGLRCQRLLAESSKTREIPVILYTVLEHADLKDDLKNLPKHVQYLPKESDLAPLVKRIRDLIRQQQASLD